MPDAYPQIDWNFAHRPNARDEVHLVGNVHFDSNLEVFYNATQGEFFFRYEGAYGKFKIALDSTPRAQG